MQWKDNHITHPAMTWEHSFREGIPCLITSYFSGPVERVCVLSTHPDDPESLEVLFRDGSQYQWTNRNVSIAYHRAFGISVSRDGRFLFVQTWDKGMFCYDVKTGAQVWRTKRRFGITNIFVNESTVLVHQHERALQLLDIETGEVLKEKKPAKAWGFDILDSQHILCHTCAKHWEIIRTEDLETVEIIPAKKFPGDRWCIRSTFLENGELKYQAFRNVWEGSKMLPNEEMEGTIEIHYQEEKQMEAMKNLLERRSIRKYKDTQVPDELLDQVLEAGLYAPTGRNTQNVVMVAVRDKETRDRMMRMNAAVMGREGDPFYGAPCVIVVLGDPEVYPVVENGSLVLGNLMNAAHAVGLGSCWIHRAKQTFETEEGKELLRSWGLKDTLVGIGNCILGYPDEAPEARPRLDGRIVKI